MKFNYIKKFFSILFIAYIIIIVTKFMLMWYLNEVFSEFAFGDLVYAIFWGYKFDFASSSVIAFLATLFDFHKKSFAIVGAGLLVGVFFIQVSDILYFNESSRHIGYEITDTLTDANSLFMTAYSQHKLFTVFSIFIGFTLFLLLYKYLIRYEKTFVSKSYILKKLSLIILTVFFIRGMIQSIPLNPWQSNQIGESKLAMLSLNSVYNIVYILANSKKNLQLMKIPKVDREVVKEEFLKMYPKENFKRNSSLLSIKPNVIFLFLESWSGVNMKSYGYDKVTTPFFDKLLTKSIRPKAMISGGHRTTEGMFSVLVSMQNPLGKSVAKTNLQSFKYSSIVDILKEKSEYSSAFFQGSAKETSGTGAFAQDLGFKDSYGKRDILKRVYEENDWGVHDHDLYNFTLDTISKMKEPFVIGINGATTHDNKIPSGIKKLEFTKDENRNSHLNALHFSDDALGDFVLKVETRYPNTLFVLFADHCGGVKGSAFENYLIPFAFYHKDLEPKFYDVYLSHRDIAPMVYDIIYGDYKKSYSNFTGKSLFSDKKFFADYYHNGVLGWVEDNSILEINIATKKSKCFNIVNFKDVETPCLKSTLAFREKLLSFTQVSQVLLHDAETKRFREYRYGEVK